MLKNMYEPLQERIGHNTNYSNVNLGQSSKYDKILTAILGP